MLEVGAGTGAVTSVLIPRPAGPYCLNIVEANPHFTDRLRDLVNNLAAPDLRAIVHPTFLEDFETAECSDVVVPGLPLTNFSPMQVDQIITRSLERADSPRSIAGVAAALRSETAGEERSRRKTLIVPSDIDWAAITLAQRPTDGYRTTSPPLKSHRIRCPRDTEFATAARLARLV
ncbi:hypothetical protein RW1_056_00400 [Rhodococcus wratislaviensis NBRC 100605]|uniref:Methyltransferase n=1 Tax=Rhodococcus wratislaviensis NBRC 100605 TaxID=1219028 RepID=X0QAJ9_RHOWR|nr:hypothetical protein RW1_056_00400 [Rhodococcus wratislaviensis NBRC 100605]